MKYVLRFYFKLRGQILEKLAQNRISSAGQRINYGDCRLPYQIPYVSQYASKELAARYVTDDNLLSSDPFWENSGADTIDEYVFWAPKLCGMACFKMILLALGSRASKWDMRLVELGKKAFAAGCYKRNPENPKRLIGLLHKPFLKFAKNYGFDGKLRWYIGPNVVASEILNKNFVIASVHHDIRDENPNPPNKFGHLVLVHGFKAQNGAISGFYIHNPSGFYGLSQENHFVPVENFNKCFSGRIIVLRWKK